MVRHSIEARLTQVRFLVLIVGLVSTGVVYALQMRYPGFDSLKALKADRTTVSTLA